MASNKRTWLVWLIPSVLCIGIVIGALLVQSFTFDASSGEGTDGNMAGAAAALRILICVLVGFPSAMFTIVVKRILRTPSPENMSVSFGLSILGGAIIGVLSAAVPAEQFVIAWFVLVFGSSLVTWLSTR